MRFYFLFLFCWVSVQAQERLRAQAPLAVGGQVPLPVVHWSFGDNRYGAVPSAAATLTLAGVLPAS
jgi:hypothetical protein